MVPVPQDVRGGRGGYANARNRRRRTCGCRERSRRSRPMVEAVIYLFFMVEREGAVSVGDRISVSTMFNVFSTGSVSKVLAKC